MTGPNSRTYATGALLLAAALALAGCGGDHEGHDEAAQAPTTQTETGAGAGTGAETGTETAAKPQFNSADVLFVQGMIPHHAQAIDMAALAEGRTKNAQVLKLATAIHGAQDPEIEQMTGWLKAWGKPLPSDMVEDSHAEEETDEHAHAEGETDDHGHTAEEEAAPHGHGGEGGMMTAAQMASLKKLKGKAFDKQFLTLMIEHHAGAVTSAKQTIERGLNPDVKKLCQAIVKGQNAEIVLMKKLLKA